MFVHSSSLYGPDPTVANVSFVFSPGTPSQTCFGMIGTSASTRIVKDGYGDLSFTVNLSAPEVVIESTGRKQRRGELPLCVGQEVLVGEFHVVCCEGFAIVPAHTRADRDLV